MGQRILSRVRVAFGLAGVAAGTAWAVGGVHALSAGAFAMLASMPALTVVAGVLILLRAVIPRGALAGPLVLIVAGSVALVIQSGVVTNSMLQRVAPALLVTGGAVVAMSRRSRVPAIPTIVARYWSAFVPIVRELRDRAPHKLIVHCLLGHIMLDLTAARYPRDALRVTVDITLLGGHVELRLPDDWTVRAGRLDLARGTRFHGQLSSAEPVSPQPREEEDGQNLFVLNVQGWSGMVSIRKGHPADPPASGVDSGRPVSPP
jgi:hypothetical protein